MEYRNSGAVASNSVLRMDGFVLLSPGPATFTYKRILNVVREATQICNEDSTGLFEEFACNGKSVAEELTLRSQTSSKPKLADERSDERDKICRMLIGAAKEPGDHIERLDHALRRLVNFKITFPSLDESESAQRVCDVLGRLSAECRGYREANDKNTCSSLRPDYFTDGCCIPKPGALRVMNYLPTPILQLAVLVTLPVSRRQNWHGQVTQAFANTIAEYLEFALCLKPGVDFDAAQLLIVRSCLWSLWHRSLSLHRYYVLRLHLDHGFTYTVQRALRPRGLRIEDIVRSQRQVWETTYNDFPDIPGYMCRDALDLLRSDPSLVGVDYATLYFHFSQAFPDHSPREEQTGHTINCSGGCPRLRRNEASYQSVTGAAAVSLAPVQKGCLNYCEASERTMAISQTWVDDPDNSDHLRGINACLHEKYYSLTLKLDCDSYWINIACLPTDWVFRKQAMELVNSVFEGSKLTLICDRDIMSLEAPKDKETDISSMEKLLATVLVCEWNLGAWSLIAATKGAKNLHLLCKDDIPVSLQDVIQSIHRRGSIELSNLCLSSYYLLKPSVIWALSSIKTLFWNDSPSGIFVNRRTRTMAVEEAGRLLSHRHTSHEKDRIHIWCLLTGVSPIDTVSEFWWHISEIRTGYILSTTSRVTGTPNFGWAPVSPDSRNAGKQVSFYRRQRFAWYAERSVIGRSDPTSKPRLRGLRAIWNFCNLEDLRMTKGFQSVLGHTWGIAGKLWERSLEDGFSHGLRNIEWGIGRMATGDEEWHVKNRLALHANKLSTAWLLLRLPTACRKKLFEIVKEHAQGAKCIALIYPKLQDHGSEDPIEPHKLMEDFTLAVISSNQGDQLGAKWRWLGVTEWDKNVSLPPFQTREITLE